MPSFEGLQYILFVVLSHTFISYSISAFSTFFMIVIRHVFQIV